MSLNPPGPPRVVVTLGVYRSASTWLANVVTELLRPQGPVEMIVADSAAEIVRQIGTSAGGFVVKTHRPDASLRCLVRVAALPVILTIRDPADCAASLMEQFGERFESARSSISLSCEAILWMLPFCRPLTLRYEAPVARDATTVARIAAHLGLAIDAARADVIAAQFASSEVKRFIRSLTDGGVFGRNPRPHHVHAKTQWHPGHLGTGHVGRHTTMLTPEQRDEIRLMTGPFRDTFGYTTAATPPAVGEPETCRPEAGPHGRHLFESVGASAD